LAKPTVYRESASAPWVRDGTLDPEVTFDLACLLMEWAPVNPVVRELAEESVEGTDLGSLADLARTLAGSGFEPGFELEPGLRTGLEQALEAVRAAMRATGLAGPVRLVVHDGTEPAHAFVSCLGSAGRVTVLHITLETGPTSRWKRVQRL